MNIRRGKVEEEQILNGDGASRAMVARFGRCRKI
jgi:hypothetical protein